MESLYNLSPVDGRYQEKTKDLQPYLSEFGLIKFRIIVELRYFGFLTKLIDELKEIDFQEFLNEENINFHKAAVRVKEIEKVCNHDVKAVEIYLGEILDKYGLGEYKRFIHFALTSQDINSVAYLMQVISSLHKIIIPKLADILDYTINIKFRYHGLPMLARTHGQPATPTTVGHQFLVFNERLSNILKDLSQTEYSTKFGGATGGYNAHILAYPQIDWKNKLNEFIENICYDTGFKIKRHMFTTQIDHYDNISKIFDILKRINVVLIDMCQDIWYYISIGYFKQRIVKEEVGSSTMPHKVNPIDFENAEGNLKIANALLECLSRELPVSRMQRDLTDSTEMRNLGPIFGHCLISYSSIIKGLEKLDVDKDKLEQDLLENYSVIAEGIQTVLRTVGVNNAYDLLKDFTRNNQKIGKEEFDKFIQKLYEDKIIDESIKKKLQNLTPLNYLPGF